MLRLARSTGMSCVAGSSSSSVKFPTTEASMRPISLLGGLMCLAVSAALAQDPVKVDPTHYKVEFENAQVRVLRIHYGAHEKTVMPYHPASVAVFLTDVQGKFSYQDGKLDDGPGQSGDPEFGNAGKRLAENAGDNAFDLVLV